MADPYISFINVEKAFGAHRVIHGLDLGIGKGEFVSLLGPSGSGKTTLLMMLAGFESVTSGEIHVGGARVDQTPPHQRNMGVVFQNYALFPHRTVAENLGFPLRMRGVARAEIRARVARALEMVELSAMAERRPHQLSGGQQQRVALARALVYEPSVILMDEPLGALDKQLREKMQLDIRALHARLGLTIILVTHDQSEALTMSDRIAVFNAGRIAQIGSPAEIYDRPATQFVAEFIGETNMLTGRLGPGAELALASGLRLRAGQPPDAPTGQDVTLCIRPERISLWPKGGAPDQPNLIPATVKDAIYQGDHLRVHLDAPVGPLIVRVDRKAGAPVIGAEVLAGFAPDDCWVLAK
ncbi:ABC transporter ATP-binding protein [Paracoccus aminophilus]|uniref:Spermidine/putrescine import ATP-binding protein PotA n=1 Tax=Paracoccus aminophilus JCM 7686 TaxID=1367847 RepID=S5XZI7_PARAH|nr:ABC transporter ATP-binding protein [Paracoccus aminophilus]AGT08860.1 spermidine/putrescine transport system, ATP-binding protein [Paracoccus aminophilus JCM 7686]